MKKRFLSMLLMLAMLLACVPGGMPAAADPSDQASGAFVFRSGLVLLSEGAVYADEDLTVEAGTVEGTAVAYADAQAEGTGAPVIRVVFNVEGSAAVYYVEASRLVWMTVNQSSTYYHASHVRGIPYRNAILDPVSFTAAAPAAIAETAELRTGLVFLGVGEVCADEALTETAGTLNGTAIAYAEAGADENADGAVRTVVNVEGTAAAFYVDPSRVVWMTADQADTYGNASHPRGIVYQDVMLDPANFTADVGEEPVFEETADGTEAPEAPEEEAPPEAAIEIVDQPVSVRAAAGADVTFTVNAVGAVNWEWQYSRDGADYSLAGGEGNTTASMTLQATAARYALYYRCRMTDADGLEKYTDVVRILEPAIRIIDQPVSVEAAIGAEAVFSVNAVGADSYEWQYSRDGENYAPAKGEGGTTASMTLTVENARYGLYYRCRLCSEEGEEAFTDTVQILEPRAPFEITGQPVNAGTAIGEDAVFTVTAIGAESYEWQYSRDGVTFLPAKGEGSDTASMTLQATAARYALYYRCRLANADGDELFTDIVRIVEP